MNGPMRTPIEATGRHWKIGLLVGGLHENFYRDLQNYREAR